MSQLLTFFKGADIRFGVFYPNDYLLAAFLTLKDAERARRSVSDAGWSDDEIIAVPGEDVVHFAEEHLKKDGLWSLLMTQLSRFIHTEAPYADYDLNLAKRGAAFLAVYCPNDRKKNAAWEVIAPSAPLVARYYTLGGVEHLAGET